MNITRLASLAFGAVLLAHGAAVASQEGGDLPADTTETVSEQSGRREQALPQAALEDTLPGKAKTDPPHRMWMQPLASGWSLMGMAQAFPIMTANKPFSGSQLRETEIYLTQPAAMFNVESPGSRWVLRTTLNFEAWTQRGGELTSGGWGEGFIDKRHPHTLLHEAMLSFNLWDTSVGSLSISAGKGFSPYGTDDPMSRPVAKYPTNHHLSQILERWTVNGVWLLPSGLSIEAGIFGGAEPADPYDFSNIESFGDSWSTRVAQRLGGGTGPFTPWEVSASYARVEESHEDGEEQVTHLVNAAIRHDAQYGWGTLYSLVEASRSEIRGPEEGYYALLGEARLNVGRGQRHQPYYRLEYSTRPEYHREGVAGERGFFRYDHDDGHVDGATRWLVNSLGYGYELTRYPVSVLPFVEVQHTKVWNERGAADPRELFGRDNFWSISAGFRLFLGGSPMRMGSYGVLDPMSAAMRPGQVTEQGGMQHHHH